jgi:cytochrome c-type biogenesis protein CcmH
MSGEPARVPGRARRAVAAATLAVAFAAAAVAIVVIAARGAPAPTTLQERVRAVAVELRCPVCQDLSVADSPSPLARAMRAKIATELQAGTPPSVIRQQFVRAYGSWILMAPPRHGLSLLVWILPIVLALAGCVLAVVAIRRWTRDRPAAPPVEETNSPKDDAAEPPLRPDAADDLSAPDRRLLDRALAASGRTEDPE